MAYNKSMQRTSIEKTPFNGSIQSIKEEDLLKEPSFCLFLESVDAEATRRAYLAGHKYGKTNVGSYQMMLVYDKPEESEILKDYLSAIELLTFNEESKLKNKVHALESEKDALIQQLQQRMTNIESSLVTHAESKIAKLF